MSSKVSFTLKSNISQAALEAQLLDKNVHPQLAKLKNFLNGLDGGAQVAVLSIPVNTVAATGTITISASGASTVVISGSTLTGGTDYANTGTTAAVATALAAAINANSRSLGGVSLVSATVAASVVTLKSNDRGIIGNLITTTATGGATAGAATLTGGASGTTRVYNLGLSSASVL